MMKRTPPMNRTLLTTLMLAMALSASATDYTLTSPDGRLRSVISTGATTTFTLSTPHQQVLAPSAIAMHIAGKGTWGHNTQRAKVRRQKTDATISSPLYRRATVRDQYNALTLQLKGYDVQFRMYDDGLAYRFVGHMPDSVIVTNEEACYHFAADHTAYVPYIKSRSKKEGESIDRQLWNDQQTQFTPQRLSETNARNLMAMPFTVALDHGERLCMVEADQIDYPGIYLLRDSTSALAQPLLNAFFPRYPRTLQRGGHGNVEMLVQEREAYIARCAGQRTYPWRSFIIGANDGAIAASDMVYRLASPCQISDVSWIKPGHAAWDWWNNSALYGVPFKAGFNNDTYRFFIDFAQRFGLEYVLIDEGWFSTQSTNIYDLAPDINLKALVQYANERGVGIILWAGYLSLARDLENAISHYSAMGIKGFKIDFLNRDDQPMLQFMQRTAQLCAQHHMLVDFHGTGKPAGFQRTWPNVVNYEAVFGLEQMRWSKKDVDMVTHDVTLPFTRMVAGPIDYTPGAMRNSLKGMYYPNKRNPMSQGTRMHQVAMYVCYDAPLTMLADSPSRYLADAPCTQFMADIPTVWDDTRVLDGAIGQYIAMARKKDGRWYAGAINGWQARTLHLTLPEGCRGRKACMMCDGTNADRVPEDYVITHITIPADGRIDVPMAKGGGWALIVDE